MKKIIINEFNNNKKYIKSLEVQSGISEGRLKETNIELFKLINGYFETEEINSIKKKIEISKDENEINLLKQQKKEIENKLIKDRFDILNIEAAKGFDFNCLRNNEFFISTNPSYQTEKALIDYNQEDEELFFENNQWVKKDIELIGFFYKKDDISSYNRISKKDKDLYIEKIEQIELLEGDKLIFNQEKNDIDLIKGELRLKNELEKYKQEKIIWLNNEKQKYENILLVDGNIIPLSIKKEWLDKLKNEVYQTRTTGRSIMDNVFGAKTLNDLKLGMKKKYKFESTHIFLDYLVWVLVFIYENNKTIFNLYINNIENSTSVEMIDVTIEAFRNLKIKDCIESKDFQIYSFSQLEIKEYCNASEIISNVIINLDNLAVFLNNRRLSLNQDGLGLLEEDGYSVFEINDFIQWWENVVLPSYNKEDGHYYVLKEYNL